MTTTRIQPPRARRPRRPRRMTEEQFVRWAAAAEERAEWVAGDIIMMASDSVEHWDVFQFFAQLLGTYARARKAGRVLGANVMVRFGQRPSRRLPDVFFVARAREHLIHRTYLDGAPDLIVEVVSPDSVSRDWREKYLEYEQAGVCEYWVVDPASRHVEAYALTKGKYRRIAPRQGKILSTVLPGLYVRPKWLWPDPLPAVAGALKELGVTQ